MKFLACLKKDNKMYEVTAIDFVNEFIESYNNKFYFDEIVLKRSTGLTDCKGKEIYEGDIVNFKDLYDKRYKNLGVIVWRDDKGCFAIKNKISTEEYELYRITAENYLKVEGRKCK